MKVTFRLPSKAFQYGFAEMQVEYPDDLTPAQVGELYVGAVLEYQLAELNAKEANRQPEKAAEELFKSELGATKVSEEKNEEPSAPWKQAAPEVSAKPWENQSPQVSLFG